MTPNKKTTESLKKDNVYFQSKDVKKMENYFLEIIKKDYFNNFVGELRKRYNIPDNGFKPDEQGYYCLPPKGLFSKEELNKSNDNIIVKPVDKDETDGVKKWREIKKEINEKICDKYKIPSDSYGAAIEMYVYYNEFGIGSSGFKTNFGLFEVDELKNYSRKDFHRQDKLYPIIIKVSPYISVNDFLYFIKNKFVWKNEIEPLLNKYREENIKIGKFKTKNVEIQEIYDYILNHRTLPRTEIAKLVNEKYGTNFVYNEISKIISSETKRRKDVSS